MAQRAQDSGTSRRRPPSSVRTGPTSCGGSPFSPPPGPGAARTVGDGPLRATPFSRAASEHHADPAGTAPAPAPADAVARSSVAANSGRAAGLAPAPDSFLGSEEVASCFLFTEADGRSERFKNLED